MGNALWYPLFRGTDDDGNPLNGGKLYSYNAGTSTPRACYAEKGAVTPLSNPVVLDSRGEKEIYLIGSYKLVLKTSTDVTIWTLDNIEGASVDDVVWGIVTNETALLALSTTGLTDGEMRICSTNGNRYHYEAGSDKFTPLPGNRYTTGDMPGASYNIETGTIAYDLTTNSLLKYSGSAWEAIANEYDWQYVSAGAIIPPVTNGAKKGTEHGTNFSFDYLAFDGGATEELGHFSLTAPPAWDRSTIKSVFLWSPGDSACSENDYVSLGLKAGSLGDGDIWDVAQGTTRGVEDQVLAGKDTAIHITDATPAITVLGSPALGDNIDFTVLRDTDGSLETTSDDMAEDLWLRGLYIGWKLTKTVVTL